MASTPAIRTDPETDEQLVLAIESLSEHLVLFDAEDRIVRANRAWKELNKDVVEFTKPGTRFKDYLRALIEKGLLPEASGREEEWLRERMERHLNPSGPFEVARQDGRWIRIHEQRLPNNGIVLITSDITERKQAEETLLASKHALQERVADLEEAQHKLEMQGADQVRLVDSLYIARDQADAANRAKSEFLAAMSHELRTPLNAVIGFSEIMKTEAIGPIGSPQYRDYANDIYDAGSHLLTLINNILDLSKVESGADELREEDIEVAHAVESVLRMVRQRAERSRLQLAVDIPKNPPLLRADPRKVKQILVNLLSNAVKFTPAGKITVKAWWRADGGYVFQVVDTGIGIALEDIPKALSQFGQVDGKLNRRYHGTGLGLPLTKALVEMHGGSFDLQSEVGVGTTVTVRFPAERIVHQPPDSEKSIELDWKAG